MSEVTHIFGGPDDIASQEVEEKVLEELLALANSGEIVGIAIAFSYRTGGSAYRAAGAINRELLGAAAQAQFALSSTIYEGEYD
jgi:hypothetical protein